MDRAHAGRPAGNRGSRMLLAAALLLVGQAEAPPARAAGPPATPVLSGLPWRSGATGGGFPCLARLRGRPLDAVTTYVRHDRGFAGMAAFTAGPHWRARARLAPLLVVSLPLLTDDTKGQFARCAAGAFDDAWRRIGANLNAAGAPGVVVRLGHEANIGSGSHPWGVDGPDQVPAYKACWRHAAAQLRSTAPGIALEWTNAKRTANPALHVLEMYPGDDVVDLWGVHYYDSGPQKGTQALWDQYYGLSDNGGPWGIGAWLAAAQAHGKELGVGEWGLWRQDGQAAPAADDPVYIDNMYRFFRDHAPAIAYETYFDAMGVHALCPGVPFPAAAARYRADWSLGR